MKKYVKPELFYESFELSQHIAGCQVQLQSTADDCTIWNSKAIGWIEGVHSDSWFVEGGACSVGVEVYCYTNGSLNAAVISS